MNYKRKDTHTVWIGLGSNLGDRKQFIREAMERISSLVGSIETASSLYETDPWGAEDTPPYLNSVVVVNTMLGPDQLINMLLTIEKELGRNRGGERYAPRTIDLDILFYNDKIIHTNNLEIPHPRIYERMFVLAPLNEVTPNKLHPLLKKTVRQLKDECNDLLTVRKI